MKAKVTDITFLTHTFGFSDKNYMYPLALCLYFLYIVGLSMYLL